MTQSTPPGWYPDGQGGQRWWDGNQWTDHVQPAAESSDRPTASEPPAQPDPADVTQVRPPEQPSGDRPAPSAEEPPAASAPTQVAGAPGAAQPGQYGAPGQPGQPAYPSQPGQPGQPAWQGQQYGGGSGGGGGVNTKLIAIIGGGVAALIVLVVLLFVVLGGGGPGGAVEDYFDAIQDQDCGFIDQLSEDNREGLDKGDCEDDEEAFFGGDTCEDSDIEIKDEKEDGDKATVDFEITGGGEDCEEKGTVKLVKEDGDWKIDSFE